MSWQRHQDGTFIGVFQKGTGQQKRGMHLKFRADRGGRDLHKSNRGGDQGKSVDYIGPHS